MGSPAFHHDRLGCSEVGPAGCGRRALPVPRFGVRAAWSGHRAHTTCAGGVTGRGATTGLVKTADGARCYRWRRAQPGISDDLGELGLQ